MSTSYFVLSKIFWFFAAPIGFFLFLLIFSVLLLHTRFFCFAKTMLRLLALCVLFFVFLPIDYWLIAPLEESYPILKDEDLSKFDGVIVLGGELYTGLSIQYNVPITPFGTERLNKFIELYNLNPKAKFVFTGGSSDIVNPEHKESYFSKMYIQNLGVKTSGMIFEDEARNTLENVLLSKKLVSPQSHEKWILITSAYHMKRAIQYFERSNWNVIPCPVGFRRVKSLNPFEHPLTTKLQIFTMALREWVGLFAAKIF